MWKCGSCQKEIKIPSRECPHGDHETELPSNLWLAGVDEPELEKRFQACAESIKETGRIEWLDNYQQLLNDNLAVSINLHPESLINLMSDARLRYVNLHDNLRANVIRDYDKELASKRLAIDVMAFKYNGTQLNFGAVNIGENVGLLSYGAACMILKSVDIKCSVSFLENNVFSYYHESGGEISFKIPKGVRALWNSVAELAIIKHTDEFFGCDELNVDRISKILLRSTGNKATDQFIEAQIIADISRATIAKIILNMKTWRKVKDDGLVGETALHMQELMRERATNRIKLCKTK